MGLTQKWEHKVNLYSCSFGNSSACSALMEDVINKTHREPDIIK